jgi:hypothetical protein
MLGRKHVEAYMALAATRSISYTATEERILRERRPRGGKRRGDLIGIRRNDTAGRHERVFKWGIGGLIVGGFLLSPVFAFLMALLVEISIGLLKDGGVPTLLAVIAAGAIGGFLFRKPRMRSQDGADCT